MIGAIGLSLTACILGEWALCALFKYMGWDW